VTLRFHRTIYDGKAVDEAVKRFSGFAAFELVEEPQHWVVTLSAGDGARERQIAGELGNFALGLTIKNGARS